jgi:hypothetical protein
VYLTFPDVGTSRPREQRLIEIILFNLLGQLTFIDSCEALELAWEVNKQLEPWLGGSKITHLHFTRTQVQDLLSSSSITCLDFKCQCLRDSFFRLLSTGPMLDKESLSERQQMEEYQGTVIVAYLKPTSSQRASTLHATSAFLNLSSTLQEYTALSALMRSCAGNDISIELHALLQNLDEIINSPGEISDEALLSKVTPIQRLCAWGAVAAFTMRSDYRFFSTCAMVLQDPSCSHPPGNLSVTYAPVIHINGVMFRTAKLACSAKYKGLDRPFGNNR